MKSHNINKVSLKRKKRIAIKKIMKNNASLQKNTNIIDIGTIDNIKGVNLSPYVKTTELHGYKLGRLRDSIVISQLGSSKEVVISAKGNKPRKKKIMKRKLGYKKSSAPKTSSPQNYDGLRQPPQEPSDSGDNKN